MYEYIKGKAVSKDESWDGKRVVINSQVGSLLLVYVSVDIGVVAELYSWQTVQYQGAYLGHCIDDP